MGPTSSQSGGLGFASASNSAIVVPSKKSFDQGNAFVEAFVQ